MNLVSLAMNFITPAIVSRIASALGIDSKIAQMAISAALPSILAGMVGKSSKPDGLSQLTSMLGQQDRGLLSNLAGMIGGSDQSKLVSRRHQYARLAARQFGARLADRRRRQICRHR